MPDPVTYNLSRTKEALANLPSVQERFGVVDASAARERIYTWTLRAKDLAENDLQNEAPFILVANVDLEAVAIGTGEAFKTAGKLWIYFRDTLANATEAAMQDFAAWVGRVFLDLMALAGAGDMTPFQRLYLANLKRGGTAPAGAKEWASAEIMGEWAT